jgi:hypothetical protein
MLSFADLEEWLLRRNLKMKGQKIPAANQAETRKDERVLKEQEEPVSGREHA